MPRSRGTLALPLALALSLGAAAPVLAQSTLALPPPGFMDPPAQAKPAPKKPAGAAKKAVRVKKPEGATASATRPVRRLEPTFSETTTKPRRFVPEEFDNGDESGSARPIMTPTGRAGIGMRF